MRPFLLAVFCLGGLTALGCAQAPNLALPSRGAVVKGPRNASGSAGKPMAANDGDVTGYGPNHGYAWGWFTEPLTVTFPESITINKVEVLLLDVDPRAYDLRLEVRAGGEWRPVEERKRASGWVTFVFGPRECSALRLVFTAGTLPVKSYHVVEVATYNDPHPEADSPLRKTWLDSRRDRGRDELGLLGVDEALDAVFLNEAAFQRAKALKEGERRWIDLDRDGDPDLIILKDQGAVIVVIDDDDDAGGTAGDRGTVDGILPPGPLPSEGGEGNGRAADGNGVGAEAPPTTAGVGAEGAATLEDRDSDCWVADLDLDGRPDRVFDYIDDDGDGDADGEHHYYLHFGWFGSRPGLVLIWDYDDDDRTWMLNRYSYEQGKCQWGCDFGGDEGFSIFRHDPRTKTWEADWECPFYFYDPDRDGLAEEAVRLEGRGRQMRALRYSVNADNDVTEGQPYDYDFAVVALGPVELPEEWLVTTPLRAGKTGPYLPYSTARDAVRRLPWQKTLLVWDENDSNIDPGDGAGHERWEGVINSRYEGFPQIGGPACGLLSKRYELDADNSGGMRLYASAVDGRLHLYGAEKGTLWFDTDGNRKADRIVEYRDTDGDGCFDEWRFDDDADGVPERTFRAQGTLIRAEDTVPLDWERVARTYVPLLRQSVAGHAAVAQALGAPLTPSPGNGNLEHSRWALEARVATEFSRQINAAQTAGDAVRAGRLERARESWERGSFDEAAALVGQGADVGQP